MSVCLSDCLFVCLSVCLSVCLFVCLSAFQSLITPMFVGRLTSNLEYMFSGMGDIRPYWLHAVTSPDMGKPDISFQSLITSMFVSRLTPNLEYIFSGIADIRPYQFHAVTSSDMGKPDKVPTPTCVAGRGVMAARDRQHLFMIDKTCLRGRAFPTFALIHVCQR